MESQLTEDETYALDLRNPYSHSIMRFQGCTLDDDMPIEKDVLMRMSSNFKKTIQERDETRVWRREKWVKDRRQERVKYDSSIHFKSFDHPIKLDTISFSISHTKLIAKRGSIDDLQDLKHLAELTVLFLQIS